MIAGPSEILVLADGSADAEEVASDLIAQAEHDVRAVSVLVTLGRTPGRPVAGGLIRIEFAL